MSSTDHLVTRIVLRPIGAPLPLGMSGLAIASLVASGLQLHWIKRSQAIEVGLILVSVPFALQLIASVLSYLARDGAAGAALGVFATSWLALGLIHISAPRSVTTSATGLLLLTAGASLALLPTLRRDKSTTPIKDRGTDQVVHEPGVRQTT